MTTSKRLRRNTVVAIISCSAITWALWSIQLQDHSTASYQGTGPYNATHSWGLDVLQPNTLPASNESVLGAYHSHLSPRAVSEGYATCYARGCRLNSMIQTAQIPGNQQTQFMQYAQLERYGWSQKVIDVSESNFSPIRQALVQFGLPTALNARSYTKISWRHLDESTGPQGQIYPPSGALYQNIYNARHGAILATYNEAPRTDPQTYDLIPADQLVPLRSLSDIWWLTWANQCQNAGQLRAIKYHF